MEFFNHQHCQYAGIKGFLTVYNDSLRYRYMITEKAKYKAKILVFWEKHGLEAVLDAFPVKRSALFLWKKKFKDNKGQLESLNEKSKCPHKKRKRTTDQGLEDFIVELRKEHPKLGKDKIKLFLDPYCLKKNITIISISTIGRIINDLKNKGKILKKTKVSFYARTGNLIERKPIKKQKKLRRKDYNPKEAGDLLQLDTIIKFIDGIKRYVITAIDLNSDFAFAYACKNHSSLSVKDFFIKLELVSPFSVKRIQTDNGSEFESYFREYIKEKNIVHFHNYPRCPKMNAKIERFNRTIQEEFINWNRQILAYDLDEFNHKLIDWLLWYNTKRPHWTLKLISPLQFIINNLFLTPKKSNMLWTDTKI